MVGKENREEWSCSSSNTAKIKATHTQPLWRWCVYDCIRYVQYSHAANYWSHFTACFPMFLHVCMHVCVSVIFSMPHAGISHAIICESRCVSHRVCDFLWLSLNVCECMLPGPVTSPPSVSTHYTYSLHEHLCIYSNVFFFLLCINRVYVRVCVSPSVYVCVSVMVD